MSGANAPATYVPGGWRARIHRYSTRLYGPSHAATWLTWIADERIAIGTIPTAITIVRLPAEGVTHVVNCRAGAETLLSQDLAVERALFGRAHVAHAPMWDTGRRQHPRRWSAAPRRRHGARSDPLPGGQPSLGPGCLRSASAARSFGRQCSA